MDSTADGCYIFSMPERSSKKAKEDLNQMAARIVDQASGRGEGKNPAAVLLGHLGGLKGGKERARRLSPERRREIARKAAKARWEKPRP